MGAVLAYAVLPIANRLDRYMPRVLAAVLAELVAVAILVLAVVAVVPPLVNGVVEVAARLPTQAEVRALARELRGPLGELQEPVRGIVLAVVTEAAANLRSALDGVVGGARRVRREPDPRRRSEPSASCSGCS